MSNAKIEIPNWQSISVQTCNFFFTESEKRLQETITAYTSNKEAAHKILAIIIPVITLSSGYVFSLPNIFDYSKTVAAITFITIQTISAALLVYSLLNRKIQTIGAMPQKLINHTQIIESDEKLQYVGIVLNHCKNLQDRIDNNSAINTRCANAVNAALLLSSVIAPAAFIIVSLSFR